MGLMDKVKKILFDEEDIEIPAESDELPEREKVSSKELKFMKKDKTPQSGFIDYHHDDVEEDTIKEVKLPKEDKVVKEEVYEDNSLKFPVDDFNEVIPSRSEVHETPHEEKEEEVVETPTLRHEEEMPVYKEELHEEVHHEPHKDYRSIIENDREEKTKKPFKVTPIISPVYGILDKNYKPDEIEQKKEVINQVNSGVKPRSFGPVSFNDSPLPKPHKYEPNKPLKEELVELNTTISELINDTVSPEVAKEEIETPVEIENEDIEIKTDNYDELTSGIEKEYIGNNNIEDAFESTSEFDKIKESDEEFTKEVIEEEDTTIEDEPSVDINKLIEEDFEKEVVDEKEEIKEEPTEEEKEELNDTIETNLFNLIDSMYNTDDQADSEEE